MGVTPLFAALTVALLLLTGGECRKYMGCYRDISYTTRLLTGIKSDFPGKLTVSICENNCKANGYRYVGLEYKKECFCSDDRPSYKYLVDEYDCSARCDGNQEEICGGNFRLSVYDLEDEVKNEVMELYQGCFEDSEGRRLLPNARKDTDLMTPEFCLGYCYSRGYRFSGMQYGKECYCGDKVDQGRKVGNGDCSVDCAGEKSFKCGGNWRLSVYKTGISGESLDEASYLGCFRDNNPEFRILSAVKYEMPETNTPERCMNLCHSEGYKYSGTQYKSECFCGNRKPSPEKEFGEDNCRMKCPGDANQFCGGQWSLLVYSTGKEVERPSSPQLTSVTGSNVTPPPGGKPAQLPSCQPSRTSVNGKPACAGQVVFEDEFNQGGIDGGKWSHSILMPTVPDYEFVVFTNSPQNSYVEDGRLVLEPTMQNDEIVTKGKVVLSNCTGQQFSEECEREAKSLYILPPVASAKLHTKNSFSFRYGTVDVRAKLPLGDWILPALWLEPTWKTYGPGLTSGRVRMALARGNAQLSSANGEIGNNEVSSGVLVASGENVKCSNVKRERPEGWHAKFHNFTFVWKPNGLHFLVDGEEEKAVFPAAGGGKKLPAAMGFDATEQAIWASGNSVAPFDQEFYLAFGLSVGGMRDFPDGSQSKGKTKPWLNWSVRAMYSFWSSKKDWYPTWINGENSLQIEKVTVTAL